jgi:glycosyltransferase involved in cell wall biosynthesis
MSVGRSPLTVCVDARLVSGERGGVEQVVIGLAGALSRFDDGDERYVFLVDPDESAWLEPFVSGPCSLLTSGCGQPSSGESRSPHGSLRTALRAAVPASIRARLRERRSPPGTLPPSDGSIERAGVDVMHFPMQVGFRTAVPSVFSPQDLQHLHLPQFFSANEIAERETRYQAICRQASIVTVMSRWGRDDILARYGLPEEKVLVVPWAPSTEVYEAPTEADVAETRRRLVLPPMFALYPAKAWPHKNHARLVAAIRSLRDEGLDVPLVLTGSQGGRDVQIRAQAEALGVADLVRFVGYVTPTELTVLYRTATMLVFPSLFEGWGIPVVEAMAAGLPVASSDVTCLPAMTAGAALLFNPEDPASIAASMAQLWRDEGLRRTLASAGRARASRFTWAQSARKLRAAYRLLGGREIAPEDRALLDEPPVA